MSLKLHQTGPGGRRTPLSLGQHSKSKQQQQQQEIIDVDELDDLPLSQSITKKSTNNQSINADTTKSDNKKSLIPVANEKHNQQSTPTFNDSKSAKDSFNDTNKKDNKITHKKDTNNDKKHENGHNNDQSKQQPQQQKNNSNGHKQNDDNKKNSESSTNGNNKEQQKNVPTKPIVMIESITKIPQLTSTVDIECKEKLGPKSKKLVEKEKKKATEENAAAIQATATLASPSQLTSTPPKRSQRAAAIQANVSIASLAFEKELKGFNEHGDEMESLIFDVDLPNDVMNSPTVIPTKAKSSTTSPIVTTSSPTKPIAPISDLSIAEEKPKIIEEIAINKSPLKTGTDLPSQLITSTPDMKTDYYTQPPSSLRSISGRRSLRPTNKEYSFQSTNFRDSYRKIQTDLDCSGNTSLNVTVGSEIAQPCNESGSLSFSFFGRGKKRDHISTQKSPEHCQQIDDEMETSNIKSPKRARLDFSGFFGMVASPVTMLRARLSRAKIENSPSTTTPPSTNNCDIAEENVENFSGNVGDEKPKDNMEEILLEKNLNENEDVDIIDISIKDNAEKDGNVDEEINKNSAKDLGIDEAEIADEDDDIIITEQENKRRLCLVM